MNNKFSKKKIGVIGGMGSRACATFFKKVVDYSPATCDQEFPELLIHNNANVPDRTRAIVYQEESPIPELLRSAKLLDHAGVDYILMTCMTAYYYHETINSQVVASLINPVELVAKHICEYFPDVKRVGLLATTGSLRTGVFDHILTQAGLEVLHLSEKAQEELFMNAVYMKNGLKSSNISDKAVTLLNEAFDEITSQGSELIIGGCTEVSIMESIETILPFVDVLDQLAKSVVNLCYDVKTYAA